MPLPHSPTENHLLAALPAAELDPTEVIAEGARVKQPNDEMWGEPVTRVTRHHPAPEKSTHERLLGDATRGTYVLVISAECFEAAGASVDRMPAQEDTLSTCAPSSGGQAKATQVVGSAERWQDSEPEAESPC